MVQAKVSYLFRVVRFYGFRVIRLYDYIVTAKSNKTAAFYNRTTV